jgi:hypothetical protein
MSIVHDCTTFWPVEGKLLEIPNVGKSQKSEGRIKGLDNSRYWFSLVS